jgi:UDP-N-acetylmuramoyl-tripeptide--D-alanyl-D-alanine ligase
VKDQIILHLERYLLALARVVLAIYKPVIIGITGSVGKTTTKEAIAHVLKENGLRLRKTEGNLNTDLGIALTVLGYDQSPAIWEWPFVFIWLHLNWLLLLLHIQTFPPYFIVEMGIDRLGDMTRMIKTIKPTIGIVTWIGEGHHLEALKDPATIAQEKGQMLTVLPKHGVAIIPGQDDQVEKLTELSSAPVIKITKTGADATPAIVQAVAEYLKLDTKKVEKALTSLPKSKGRLNELKGINGSMLIDDTYNSSLPAVRLALDVLKQHNGGRKIAILGDILEQGDQEAKVHEAIAKLANEKADLFVGVGKRLQSVKTDMWFASPDDAAASLPAEIKKGDVILVKGSQGLRMEKVSYALAADKEEAKKNLPRQNARWQQIEFKNP